MTGFGVGRALLRGAGDVTVEARSVNHKYLDLRVHLPDALSGFSLFVEQRARQRIQRGRFDLRVRLEERGDEVTLDTARARGAFEALAKLRDELAPGEPLPLALLGSVPDLFRGPPVERSETEAVLGGAVDEALTQLEAMRAREGVALADELKRHLDLMRAEVRSIAAHAAGTPERQRDRLRERIARLLADTEIELDRGRLEQEVALLADRSDITEELVRLEAHFDQATEMLQAEGHVGRKLDFLCQEMTREVNTIGSKSPDATIAHAVVELKAGVGRLREQVQNVA